MTETTKFEQWCICELLGHKRFAGFVTEQALGGASFIRVDVPEVTIEGQVLPPFTKLLGAGSIYAITICTEETARAFAAMFQERAFPMYEAPRLTAPDRTKDCGHTPEDCDCDPPDDIDDDDDSWEYEDDNDELDEADII